nr:Abi-alpha family protein [Siccibacter turicensis]
MIVLRNFSQIGERAGCEYAQLVPAYLDNLIRMGLCEIPEGLNYSSEEWYTPLLNHPVVVTMVEELQNNGRQNQIKKAILLVTDFGRQFALACCPNP